MVFDWLVLLTARVAELVGAKRRKVCWLRAARAA